MEIAISQCEMSWRWGGTNRSEGLQGHVQRFRVARDLAGDKVGVGGIQQKVCILIDSPVGADSGDVLATRDASSVGGSDVDSSVVTDRATDHDVLHGRGVGLPKELVLFRHGAGRSLIDWDNKGEEYFVCVCSRVFL